MKAFIISISIALILFGMWAISRSFTEVPSTGGDQEKIGTVQRQEGSPMALGLATLVGGVLLLVIASRRRAA